MINGVKQSFVASTTSSSINTNNNKEIKANETQKPENERLSRIAEQIKKGEYKLDMGATANAMADYLL